MPNHRPLAHSGHYDQIRTLYARQGLSPATDAVIDNMVAHDRDIHRHLQENNSSDVVTSNSYNSRFLAMIALAIGAPQRKWPDTTWPLDEIHDFQRRLHENLPGLGWTLEEPR